MTSFILNTVGFFMQFATTVFLSCLPFGDDSFRLGKRRTIALAMVCSLAVSVLFGVTVCFTPAIEVFGSEELFCNTYMLVTAAALSLWYFNALKCSMPRKSVSLCLAVFYEVTQYVAVNLLLWLFPDDGRSGVYNLETVLMIAATMCVMLPMMIYLLRGPVREYLLFVSTKTVARELSKIIIISGIYLAVLFVYSGVIPQLIDWDTDEYSLVVLPIMAMNIVFLLVFYVSSFRDSLRHERDAEYNGYLEIQRIEYRKITQEIENMRRSRHDLRHHLATIYELASDGSREELLAYIEELLSVAQRGSAVRYCENASINGLLQYYVTQGKTAGVECSVHAVCGEIAVPPVDITVMLGNTLDNALRACEGVSGRKFLDITIGVVGGMLAIIVTNSCSGVHPTGKYNVSDGFLPAEAFGSMRQDGGIGLKSIAATARTYDGDAQFRYDAQNMSFTTRIRLNIAQTAEQAE